MDAVKQSQNAELVTHMNLHMTERLTREEYGSDHVLSNPDLFAEEYVLPSRPENNLLESSETLEDGNRDGDQDLKKSNVAKPKRAKSPPRAFEPAGGRRLGVFDRFLLIAPIKQC